MLLRKTSKKALANENKHLCLFSHCFGKTHSWIQIKSSDYYNGASLKSKYLTYF